MRSKKTKERFIQEASLLRKYCKEKKINLLEIGCREYTGDKLKKFGLDYFGGSI